MAIYTLAPHWVRISYTTNALTHTMNLACSVVDDTLGAGDYSLNLKNGLTAQFWESEVDALVAVIKALYNNGNTTFDTADLYRQLPNDESPVLLSTYTIAVGGTNASTNEQGSQASFMFKGTLGGNARLVCLEPATLVPHARRTYTELNASAQAVVNEFSKAGTPWKTRRGGFIGSFRIQSSSYNDSLTRKRFGVS